MIWERVKGIHILMGLLPGAYRPFPKPTGAELSRPEDFTLRTDRFNIYAPFVKHLEICGISGENSKIPNLDGLIALSNQQILLPNLVSLTMMPCSTVCFWNWVFWIRIFACESLVTVVSTPPVPSVVPEVSHLATSVALKWIVDHCPRLESVSLYPSQQAKNVAHITPEVHKLLAPLYEQPFHHYLLPTLGIRQLSCSLAVLGKDALEALSMLPHLERLTVYKTSESLSPEPRDGFLSQNSFPSLKHLRLNLITCSNAHWALSTLALFKNLKSLVITVECPNPDFETLTNHSFFSALEHATHLENLSVVFDVDTMDDMLELGNMSVFCSVLRQLSLQRVSIMPLALPFPDITSINFGSAWSQVTHLCLPAARVFLHTLPVFCQLPRLEYLLVCLGITARLPPERMPTPSPDLRLHTLEGSSESEIWHNEADVDKVISLLASLWPKIRQVKWPEPSGFIDAVNVGLKALQDKRNALRVDP
ncbi:hypothetical protein FRC08_014121 [Ceratobasidium sp. 394]|nr:hypothetical protein FRC08_014121 [Ceratobasidium sp. 394]